MSDTGRIRQTLASLISRGRNRLERWQPFRSKAGRPYERSRDSSLRLVREELKFVRSFDDLKAFYRKMMFFMPRMIGTLGRFEKVPPDLEIEPTNYCNLNCICCPASRSTRKKGFMDFALFQKIIDDASQIGVKRVHLYLHGESLLHPQIVEMISYTKSKDLALNLTTNGMRLDREMGESILRSGVNSTDYVTFSVLGFSRHVYEKIMRRGNHDRAVNNIREFVKLRDELGVNGPVISTVFFIMPENEHEAEQYLRYWRGIVDHARLCRISESFSEHKREGKPRAARTKTCAIIWEKMTIFWNGDVTTCAMDVDGERVLGNLNEQTVSEIWNSEQLLAIRQIHREKRFEELPFCYNCDM